MPLFRLHPIRLVLGSGRSERQGDCRIRNCSHASNCQNRRATGHTSSASGIHAVPAFLQHGNTKETAMRLQNLVPVLDVQDVDESIHFYTEALGFTVHDKVIWGGRTEWALLRSGQVQLMLCAGERVEEEEQAPSDVVFFVYLENIEALHVYLGAKGFTGPEQEHGMRDGHRDFYLRDPDGYVLWFSHKPLAPSSAAQTNGNRERLTI